MVIQRILSWARGFSRSAAVLCLLALAVSPAFAQGPGGAWTIGGAIFGSSAAPPGPLATCTPSEVDLRGVKLTDDHAQFNWTATAPWANTGYAILRQTSPIGLRQAQPYAEITNPGTLTYTDTMATADLLFYEVVPRSLFFSLEWPGPYMVPADAKLNDGGFRPTPFMPYTGAPEDVSLSGDPSEFWVDARSIMGCVPTAVELLLDRNDDGDYDDAGEVIPMTRQAPDPPVAADSLYSVALDQVLAKGTPPTPTSILYARDETGQTRWAKADGTGQISYRFRAWDGSAYATGPASTGATLTLLNTAKELIEDLGIPVVVAGACSYDTDWAAALVYFEEAEALLKPPSPFNQASPKTKHPDYLSALMASTIAETATTLRNYDTLFQSDGTKLYRDVMLDWIAFADEQIARLDALALAPSYPDPASWKMDFPLFCIFTEGGSAPFAATQALAPLPGTGLPGTDLALPFGLVPAPGKLRLSHAEQGLRAPAEPVYIFGDNADAMAEWDRSDAYLLKAYALSLRTAAVGYRIYEAAQVDPEANVKVSDLGWIETALRPEEDAEAHAECDPKPCPPLNGLDDDGDGLVDDLGFAARVVEMFPGLGIYAPDGALTLEHAADDSSAIIAALREGMRLVLEEGDNQTVTGQEDRVDATLVFEHNFGIPPSFLDDWSYTAGAGVPDGLPDLVYAGDDILPLGWCEPEGEEIDHAPPMDIQGGLGDDIEWWIDQAIEFYNEYSGQPPLDPACYPQAWAYTVLVADWGYQWQKAVLPAADPDHICFNFRDDAERLLDEYDIDPADLGPDAQTILNFLECIDVRQFIDAPEDVRNYLPFSCPPPAAHDAPACAASGTYSLNGFYGDWDEPTDPIVAGRFWTIEPFSAFNQDDHGILVDPAPGTCTPKAPYDPDADCHCDPSRLSTDQDCIRVGWEDADGDGRFDLFERVLMADSSTPLSYIDLNGDGQWNGWADREHKKALYAGEPADPGRGLYNAIYVYFQDPTFGGRLAGMTNEGLNDMLGAVAGWADGLLEYPSDNHHPAGYGMVQEPPTPGLGTSLRLHLTATDPDGDALHFKLVLPPPWSGAEILVDGRDTSVYELAAPSGTWGFVGLIYDNVNNLNDLAGTYLVVTVP